MQPTTAPVATTPSRCTAKHIQQHLTKTRGTSIGDVEQLAGINIQCHAERRALWFKYRELFTGPHDVLWSAIKADLLKRTAHMVNAGQLSLYDARKAVLQ